jgi:AmmeMemoRadiSam system protein B
VVKRLLIIGLIIGVILVLPVETERTPAYLNTEKPYLDAYEKAGEIEKIDNVKGIIINHHFFGSEYMAEIIQTVKSSKSKTVVLISPNHFSTGKGNIQVGSVEFDTPFGVLKSDKKTIGSLSNLSDSSFEKEHGITAIVGFLKKEIPRTKVVPIIIKDSVTEIDLENLKNELHQKIPKDSVIIASLDFSHYVPLNYAKFQDEMALSAIKNFEIDRINKINIDSVPTLKLMLGLMDLYGYKKFNLMANSSSSIIQNDYETLENTSYITGYFSPQDSIIQKPHTNIFIASQTYTDHPEPFRFITGSDFVFLNYSSDLYQKYGVQELAPFENEQFNLNNNCPPDTFGIEIKNVTTENKIEYQDNCLKVQIKKGQEFDLGVSMYEDQAKIYYLPSATTDIVNTELNFVQGISIIQY